MLFEGVLSINNWRYIAVYYYHELIWNIREPTSAGRKIMGVVPETQVFRLQNWLFSNRTTTGVSVKGFVAEI